MRLGLSIPQFGAGMSTAASIAQFATTAEQLGYDSLWVADRLATPVRPQSPYPGPAQPYPPEFTRGGDPLLVWAVAATATHRIRLGSSTLNGPHYQPVQLARALTTLDVLSQGRLDVGLGLGWMRDEYDMTGVPWHERGRRLDDLLDFLSTWWTADRPVEHHSPYLTVPPLTVNLRPVQSAGPPIYLGGFSVPALQRVGRRATGWLTADGLPDELTTMLWQTARRAAEEAGRDPDSLRRVARLNPQAGATLEHISDLVTKAEDDGMDEAFVELVFARPNAAEAADFAAKLIDRHPHSRRRSGDGPPIRE